MNEREQEIFMAGVKAGLMATGLTENIADNTIATVKKGRPFKEKEFKTPNSQRYMKYVSKVGKVSYKPNPNWDGTPSNKGKKGPKSRLAKLNQ